MASVLPSAVAATAVDGRGPLVLTERDSGKRVFLPRHRPTFVRLSNRWLWSNPRLTGRAVRLTPVDYRADPGYVEWKVEKRQPGKARATSRGTPNCRSCDRPTRTFRVTIVVRA